MNDFQEYKARKEGVITPAFLIENLLEEIGEGGIESVAFVARYQDGTITTGWSDMSFTETIGLMEAAKMQVLNEMWRNSKKQD